MRDVLEIVVRLGDTTLEHHFVPRLDGIEPAQLGRAWVHVQQGLVDIALRRTSPPERHALAAPPIDRRSLGYVALSLAAHLIVWGVAASPPPPAISVASPPRIASITSITSSASSDEADDEEVPVRLALGSRLPMHVPAPTRPAPDDPYVESSVEARLGALLRPVDYAAAFHDLDTPRPLLEGDFGFGARGAGVSCDGIDPCANTIGTGRYVTIGQGRGAGEQRGMNARSGGMSQRDPLRVIPCAGPSPCMVATGGLDKEVIRRFIRRALPKIQYCYERELLVHSTLEGSIDTHFMIGPDGRVETIEADGMSPEVARCVAGVIEHIAFPRWPAGRSDVRYPFTFRRAGA